MKSVLKAVAPIALITLTLSGVSVAETAPAAAKAVSTATTTAKETAKPIAHQHQEASKKVEQAAAKDVVSAPEKAAEKSTSTVATVEKTTKVEPSKTESSKVETTKLAEPAKAK